MSLFEKKKPYNARRDGSLDEYIRTHSIFHVFRGFAQYQMLWRRGYFVPDASIIKLLWDESRVDEEFRVRGEFEIEGTGDGDHGTREGVHDPREVLTNGPLWEAYFLATTPERVTFSK